MTVFHDLPFRRGSRSTTDLNRRASTSDTGSEWGSGSDDQEPDFYRVRQCNILSIQDEEIGVDCGVKQNIVFIPPIVIIPSDNHLPGSPSQAHLVLAKLRQCLFQCARGENQQRQECWHEATQSQQGKFKKKGSSKKKAFIPYEDINLVFDDLEYGFHGAVTMLVQQTK